MRVTGVINPGWQGVKKKTPHPEGDGKRRGGYANFKKKKEGGKNLLRIRGKKGYSKVERRAIRLSTPWGGRQAGGGGELAVSHNTIHAKFSEGKGTEGFFLTSMLVLQEGGAQSRKKRGYHENAEVNTSSTRAKSQAQSWRVLRSLISG